VQHSGLASQQRFAMVPDPLSTYHRSDLKVQPSHLIGRRFRQRGLCAACTHESEPRKVGQQRERARHLCTSPPPRRPTLLVRRNLPKPAIAAVFCLYGWVVLGGSKVGGSSTVVELPSFPFVPLLIAILHSIFTQLGGGRGGPMLCGYFLDSHPERFTLTFVPELNKPALSCRVLICNACTCIMLCCFNTRMRVPSSRVQIL
jgi:hypothetical protein